MKLELIKDVQTESRLKARWVAALRSGEYKQTYGVLRSTSNEYCCLGVLCNIVDSNGWKLDNGCDSEYTYGHDDVTFLPTSVEYMLPGIAQHTANLMNMNDKLGKSFEEIADYIEANVNVAE